MEDSTQPASCAACKKTRPDVNLKHCAKCSVTLYCSRECQKNDWKVHKKICGKQKSAGQTGSGSSDTLSMSTGLSPPKGLDSPVTMPFTRLERDTWLHDRLEKDVYRLLIDAYRMRMEDNYVIDHDADEDGIYGGAPDGLPGFRRFLQKAARSDVLPPWWNDTKKQECEQLGMDHQQSNWYDLARSIKKSDIVEHYGDPRFPMQLRMLA